MGFLPGRVSILAGGLAGALACVAAPAPTPTPTPVGGGGPAPAPAAGAAVAPTIRSEPMPEADRQSIPFQRWSDLPGKHVGLLVTMTTPWGRAIDWSGGVWPTSGGYDRHTYYYYSDGESARALYFTSDGRGENFLKNWGVPTPGGTAATYDAAMFGPATPNAWGLRAQVHLVEVDVNGGQGGQGLHFVATNTRVLDGQGATPIRPMDALGTARQRFDAWLREVDPAIDRALADASVAVGGPVGAEKTETAEGFFPTWDNQKQELRVIFVRRVSRASSKQLGMKTVGQCTKYRKMQPPPPPPPPPVPAPQLPVPVAPCPAPRQVAIVETRSYAVAVGIQLTFDARGVLVDELRYTPTTKLNKSTTDMNY